MYKLEYRSDGDVQTVIIRRLSDGAFIPAEPGNGDYREYLQWLEDGNTPQDPE